MQKTDTPNRDHAELRRHFVESLYETLEDVISPTPYLSITDGEQVIVRFLDGKGELPQGNTTEVTILDTAIAAMFLDLKLLGEGITGVGKTYTADALFGTVFGPDGYCVLRLGGGLLGQSALEPFTTTTLDDGGLPKTRLDEAKCQQYGGLFVDEINRGEMNETFQAVDGEAHVNGERAKLGLPIPGTNRLKKLAIIAAMNPAGGQYSSAVELDVAGENRFLKFQFPNGVEEAGTSQLDTQVYTDLHQQFWEIVRERTGLVGSWRELYPVIADREQLHLALDGEAREFLDVALGYVGKDPLATFERNKKLMEAGGYQARMSVAKGNDLTRIQDAQKQLKLGFVRRDLDKIEDLALLLGFVKSVKQGKYQPTVSLTEVAASLGIVLESKRITGAPEGHLMALVNDALHAYHALREQEGIPAFEGRGIRQAYWQAACYAGHASGMDAYLGTLQKALETINTQTPGIASTLVRSRIAADLAVLDHFSKQHATELAAALQRENVLAEAKKVYDDKKKAGSVYEHRLASIFQWP